MVITNKPLEEVIRQSIQVGFDYYKRVLMGGNGGVINHDRVVVEAIGKAIIHLHDYYQDNFVRFIEQLARKYN